MMNKLIATVTVDVPYKSSGGVIHQHAVPFDVYQAEDHYSLRPKLDEASRQVANLPEELRFVLEDGKPVSLRGKRDGNFHVIADAVQVLRTEHKLALAP